MMQEILDALKGLDENHFEVHVLDDAWYSQKAITRAIGNVSQEELEKIPSVKCVRVALNGHAGMLELHEEDGKIRVRCYCCFGGNPEQGIVPLEQLKEKVQSLKDHQCPPWPG